MERLPALAQVRDAAAFESGTTPLVMVTESAQLEAVAVHDVRCSADLCYVCLSVSYHRVCSFVAFVACPPCRSSAACDVLLLVA